MRAVEEIVEEMRFLRYEEQMSLLFAALSGLPDDEERLKFMRKLIGILRGVF